MSKKNVVSKANTLVEACYKLNLVPQRLILLAIIEAREQGEMIKAGGILKIRALDYAKHFNVNKVTAYEMLEAACTELFDSKFIWQSIDINGNIKRNNSRFVQRATYVEGAGYVEIMFSEDIMPLITRLSERYTEYDLKQIERLKSSYSLRLFELLMQWSFARKTPPIKVQEFRERIGVSDTTYSVMSDFKKRILDPAVKDISKNTNINVKCKQYKEGVKIVAFSFSFTNKKILKVASKEIAIANTTQNMEIRKIRFLSDAQIETFGDKLFKNFDFIRDIMGQADAFKGKDNVACKAYIKTMLKDPKMLERWAKYLYLSGYKPPDKQTSNK